MVNIRQQVPRNALVWIILCLFTVVAPHALRLPFWVLILYVVAVVWRIMVYRGRWSYPGGWVKVFMTFTGFLGILASYRTLIGLEPTVALLLTAFALKLIELSHRKDAYVIIFLGFFICVTEFLFSQDILITLYSLVNVVLLTTALVALHQPGEHQFTRRSLRLAAVMLAQAFPLMVVIFFLFPRFGPLWTVPIKNHTAKTGMSDFMKPGDVASLSQSGEVAFRAKFTGDIPEQSELYWRGLVFSRLEQGAWSALGYYAVPLAEQRPRDVDVSGAGIRYSIIMEPTQQNWLYGLNYSRASTPGVMHTSDFRLYSPAPVESEYMYRARSWADAQMDTELSQWRRKTELKLPPKGNPRAREFATQLRASLASDAELVDEILMKFRNEEYVYTLNPGRLSGNNAMDQFLFESRRGFCEHYASAFVVMMRAAGVPARVVAGYQGGEINPVNKTVIVHQFDAHAWAEVWLDGEGWVRVDPTAAVSPDRIEWGLEAAMEEEGSFLADAPLSALRYRNIPLLNLLRLRYDALTYRWQSWVVGFDSEQQFDLLRDVFGEVTTRKFAAFLLGSWALVLIPVGFSLLNRKETHQITALDKHYLAFCDRLAGLGVERERGEAPSQFAARAAQALPTLAPQLSEISGLYNELAYGNSTTQASALSDELESFIKKVAAFKPNRRRTPTVEAHYKTGL
ncbi:MAG: transglutaminase-like putative cysteine protease [Halioglobus sp.]|jgi:transglutaminase-like putative cysteine protease